MEEDIFFEIFRENHNALLMNILDLGILEYFIILESILREFIIPELFYPIVIAPGIFMIEDLLVIFFLFNMVLLVFLLEFFKTDDEIFKYKLKFFNGVIIFFKNLIISKVFIKIV